MMLAGELEPLKERTWSIELELARIALASLEAEPAIHRWRRVTFEPYGPYPWHYGNFIGFSKPVDGIEDEYYYAAPPAPVSVPAAMEMDDDFDSAFEHGKAVGWNAYRAAMLQGAEPAKGWIPCSERMPEEIGRYWCYVEEQNCLGKSHYQWNCSWNGDRWWVESENGGRVTHWMPLPNQPKE
ncbi:DUF551 domain-containing protein [Enterobacter hormaechei]|nr:DUF551 domain-containing protein [Enterobacter hormaechei]EKU5319565.1 DUF551 domain-containing protein [Enterobacter hormaechei]EKU5377452.1 DUF551 domain-containing protein [Enterobacter hormaechei]EKU5388670.1 DUF551 domain-containing protein [Enterobacter hormaechei]EKU5417378.1 DUF551 domain-containing protein [Enterobacter hormaechei]